MDAVEYELTLNRMCDGSCGGCHGNACPLFNVCDSNEPEDLKEKVAIVEQWAKEHPVKTYKDVLLEKFPKAKLDKNGVPKICKEPLGGSKCRPDYDCKKCWNEEYREE